VVTIVAGMVADVSRCWSALINCALWTSTRCCGQAYGKQKQGVAFGHTTVGRYNVLLHGYHPLVATLSTPRAAPVVAATRRHRLAQGALSVGCGMMRT
jgi:hypothetical protein